MLHRNLTVSRADHFAHYTDLNPDVRFNAGEHNGCHLATAYSNSFRAWRRTFDTIPGTMESNPECGRYANLRREGFTAVEAYHRAMNRPGRR